MNTSGPSSRPRNPYPFALLNHLTVPFKRSTFAPSLILAEFPEKARFQGPAKKCVGIVLLKGVTVKAQHYTNKPLLQPVRGGNYYPMTVYRTGRAISASHRIPEIVLASRMRPLIAIRFASDKLKNLTAIRSSGSGWASPACRPRAR